VRSVTILILTLWAAAARARVAIAAPAVGTQAIGPLTIEVTTDAAKIDRVEISVDGTLAGVLRKAPYRIAYDFGTSLDAHTVVAKVYANGYTSTETATITTASLALSDRYNVDLVEVPLRVRAGRTLRAEDLRVRENDVEQTISEVRADRGAAQFVFVVDRSLSMGDGRLTAALRAIDDASKQLRPGDTLSIVLFNHNVSRMRTIAHGERVAAVFAEVVPSGGTSLRDAIAAIPSKQRTYAIVITDGGDRNSVASEEEALRGISGTRTVVDALVFSDSRFLSRAAHNTGGVVASVSRDTIARALNTDIADINSRYTLVYQSHGTPNGWRTIRIEPKTRGVEVVNARKGYFAQ